MSTHDQPAPQQMTGRRERRDGIDQVVLERTFRAGIDDVWAACTDPIRMERWIGTWTGDPASGEVAFRMTAEGDDVPEEIYDVEACDPPHRFVVRSRSTQPFSEDGSGEPITWVLRLELREEAGSTRLSFTQQVPHVDVVASVGPGWEYYLDRLAASLGGGEVAAVTWERYEGGSTYYRELFA